MIQFYKLFSLVIRVFTKPLVNYTKQYHMSNKRFSHEKLRIFFIFLGHKYHYLEYVIERSAAKNVNLQQQKLKLLTEETALEKGVDFFYEMLMYCILLCFPLYELYRAAKDGKQKNERTIEKLANLEDDVQNVHRTIEHQTRNINKRIKEMKESLESSQRNLEEKSAEMSEGFKKNRKILMSSFNENMELIEKMKGERAVFEENFATILRRNADISSIMSKLSLKNLDFQ